MPFPSLAASRRPRGTFSSADCSAISARCEGGDALANAAAGAAHLNLQVVSGRSTPSVSSGRALVQEALLGRHRDQRLRLDHDDRLAQLVVPGAEAQRHALVGRQGEGADRRDRRRSRPDRWSSWQSRLRRPSAPPPRPDSRAAASAWPPSRRKRFCACAAPQVSSTGDQVVGVSACVPPTGRGSTVR